MKLLHKTLAALSCVALTVAPMVTTASAKGFDDLGSCTGVVIGGFGKNLGTTCKPGNSSGQWKPGANIFDFIEDFLPNNGGNCSPSSCGGQGAGGNCDLPSHTPGWPDQKPELPDGTLPDNGNTDNTPQADLTNYAAEVVELVNTQRKAAGLPALKVSGPVQSAAQVRAAEQAVSFSHTRPDGSSCFTALSQAGASYNRAGENIAWGQATPQAVMQGWMNSSGHRANILNPDFGHIGVGYYQDENGTPYWTQMFTD